MARRPRKSSRRGIAIILIAVAVLPAVALAWLGLRLLGQDEALVAQRDQERRQALAPALVRELTTQLRDTEHAFDGALPAGTVRVQLYQDRVTVEPRDAAAWLPVTPSLAEANDAVFADADARELRDPAGALALFEGFAKSPDPAVRVGALLRISGHYLLNRNLERSLDAYQRMAAVPSVNVLGAPADLQARRWACQALRADGRRDPAVCDSAVLVRDFVSGRWSLDREMWIYVAKELGELTGIPIEVDAKRHRISALTASLFTERASSTPGSITRRFIQDDGSLTLTIARHQSNRSVALILPPESIGGWLDAAVRKAGSVPATVGLTLESGEVLAGTVAKTDPSTVIVPASQSGHPWTLIVATGDTSDLVAEFGDRRRLVVVALLAPLLVLAGGGFLAWRLMRRELEVSRQQAEFVAAVSHEFRTPLSSLRHVTELLQEHDEVPIERRRQFYDALARNTGRLQRLVESLLDFSRMESGRKPYDQREMDPVLFVRDVVAEFGRESAVDCVVRVATGAEGLTVHADEAALASAVWNLLDNAAKYSPNHQPIDVSVTTAPGVLRIAVTDKGLGIPAGERPHIFDRFFRGADASSRGIKGTGLGLAIVAHIVRAHGGSIDVVSEVGAGSTFTIVLPLAAASTRGVLLDTGARVPKA